MLKELKFVQGAVAKKDFVPALTHFQIKDGVIRGYNGSLCLSSPIECDLNTTPKAAPFTKAIETCKSTVAMSITKAGRLSIRSGKFRAYIECTDEIFPEVHPEGSYIELRPGLLEILAGLSPFIAQDASRPWATGILFRGESAFATNNIILVEQWLGYRFPVEINIPAPTIKELLRIKEDPLALQISDHSITFHFEGKKWLRSGVSSREWPDLSRILEQDSVQQKIPEDFFPALEALAPFTDELDRVYLEHGIIKTRQEDGEGAVMQVDGIESKGCFQLKQLQLLQDKATSIDLTLYPRPCVFHGKLLRGAIVGMRFPG